MKLVYFTYLSILSVNALTLQAIGRRSPRGSLGSLRRRANVQGSSGLSDHSDTEYFTNVTLNGVSFDVLIDTGSADLWVAGSVPGATDSGKTAGVSYAIGAVKGSVKFATLDLFDTTVSKQAYIEITPDDTNPSGTGLLGLGPSSGSNVFQALNNAASAAGPLDRIFAADTSSPNVLTVLMGRRDDPEGMLSGEITIGEVLDNMTDINSQPKFDVIVRPTSDAGNQHFTILLDQILGPDGKSIPFTTLVPETQNSSQPTAILDTGFSLPQVPKYVSDAIYSRIVGAQFVNITKIGAPTWIVPCTQEVNLTFQIGGIKYPVHPLDTALDPSLFGIQNLKNSQGQDCCIGMFQPIVFDAPNSYDIILGMAFLRNVYTLFNYGDFIAGETTKRGPPFVQLLSIIDPAKAHADFVETRLGGVDTTGLQVLTVGVNDPLPTPVNNSGGIPTKTILLIVGAVALGLLVLIILAVSISRCRRRSRNSGIRSRVSYRQIDLLSSRPINGQMHDNASPAYNPAGGQEIYDTQTYEKYSNLKNPWD